MSRIEPRIHRPRLGLLVVPLIAIAVVTGSVTSATVPGHAVPGMTPADLGTLNVGPYQANPADYRPERAPADHAYRAEARRMFGYLADPSDADPDLNFVSDVEIIDSDGAGTLDNDHLLPQSFPAIASAHQLIGGVMLGRNNRSLRARRSADIALLRFRDAAAASAAAGDLNGAMGSPGRHPLPAPEPGDLAGSADDATGRLLATRGAYLVLIQAVVPRPDPVALTERLTALARAQFTAMAGLTPTPLDDIPALPVDRDAMMRRALADPPAVVAPSDYTLDDLEGVYNPGAALHFEDDADLMRRAFAADGVDLVAQNAGKIYRTTDLDAAYRLQATLTLVGHDDQELTGPPGIVDAHCVERDEADPVTGARSICAVVYGRYVGLVGSADTLESSTVRGLYQRAAAQYSILARTE